MATSVKTKDRDRGLKQIVRELIRGEEANVTVGVHEDAGETEAGVPLGSVGFWLDQGTKRMPARPWVRATTDKFSKRYQNIMKQNTSAILLRKMTVKEALTDLGEQVRDDMKNFIENDQVKPETSTAVMDKKKVKKTLFETGKLVDAINFKVNE